MVLLVSEFLKQLECKELAWRTQGAFVHRQQLMTIARVIKYTHFC